MQEVYEMLKKAGTYYLATCEEGQPRVRPFGTVNLYKGKLYIQTGKSKAVSRQLHANPKLEICAMVDGKWLRVEASAVEDDAGGIPGAAKHVQPGRRQHRGLVSAQRHRHPLLLYGAAQGGPLLIRSF